MRVGTVGISEGRVSHILQEILLMTHEKAVGVLGAAFAQSRQQAQP